MRSRPLLIASTWTLAAMLATVSTAALAQADEFGGRSESVIRLQVEGIEAFSLSLEKLLPGESVQEAILVANDGPTELRYSMAISSQDPDGRRLSDVLAVAIHTADGSSSPLCGSFDGAALYSGMLGAEGGFGDPAAGADRGDRRLGPGQTDVLCVRVALPLEADNAYQGASTTAIFAFTAEQTRDNP